MTPLVRASLSACLVLSLAEGAARVGVRAAAPHCYDTTRNLREGYWAQYTAPRKRRPDQRLIILITNSQGRMRRGGGLDAYPARLQQQLAQWDPQHEYLLANWAMTGGNLAEMIVLAARAAAHRPDAVLLVTYTRNFREDQTRRTLEESWSDVSHLAYLPEVRRHLSPWFLEQFQVRSPRGWLAARSVLVQLHERFVSLVKGQTVRPGGRPALITAEPWTGMSSRLLDEFYRTFRHGLPTTPLVIVSMPLNPVRFTPESWPNILAFFPKAQGRLAGEPRVAVLDATGIVETRHFSDDTHVGTEGHDQFARWLFPRVAAVLETPS